MAATTTERPVAGTYRVTTDRRGNQVYTPVKRRSWKMRALLAVCRVSWRLNRRAWARRRPLAPAYAGVAVFVFGAIAHAVPHGNRSVLTLAGLLAAAAATRELVARRIACGRRLRPLRRGELIYLVAAGGGVTAWLYWAAVDGVTSPRPAWWLALTAAAWLPALWRYRIRTQEPGEPHQMVALWDAYAATADGIAPGSTMRDVRPLDPADPSLATTALIELPPTGKVKLSSLLGEVERVTMLYDIEIQDVVMERRAARVAALTVFNRNPLRDRVWWPGPQVFDPSTGAARVARYATGGEALYRFYGGAGPVHDLIAGVTGSGKSAFINALLAVERSSPWMASVVIDPQQGQSLPTWVDNVAAYARSVSEGRLVLQALVAEMLERNRLLSDVEWVDSKGRARRGVDSFYPRDPIIRKLGLPLIVVTIEEAAMQLADPESLAAVISLATMLRKCGGKLRLVFQTPLLDQVRSNVLREQLIGGNVISFRTGSPISGQVVLNGVLPASPHLLPREWDDGSTAAGVCYVLGPEARPVIARTWPIEDVYHWATAGETTLLPEVTARLDALRNADEAGQKRSDVREPEQAAATSTYPQRILAYLADVHPYATTGTLQQVCGDAPKSSISSACRRLEKRGQIVDHGYGMWGSLDTEGEKSAGVAA